MSDARLGQTQVVAISRDRHNRISTMGGAATVTLYVMDCWNCGIVYAVPNGFDDERQKDRGTWYCPNGHGTIYPGDTAEVKARKKAEAEAKSLRQRLEWANAREKSARDQADAAERSRRAQKGLNTKLRKRIANGVCPCCNRSFVDLQRHMNGQHPDYVKEEAG